jgi:hypothetical protein
MKTAPADKTVKPEPLQLSIVKAPAEKKIAPGAHVIVEPG